MVHKKKADYARGCKFYSLSSFWNVIPKVILVIYGFLFSSTAGYNAFAIVLFSSIFGVLYNIKRTILWNQTTGYIFGILYRIFFYSLFVFAIFTALLGPRTSYFFIKIPDSFINLVSRCIRSVILGDDVWDWTLSKDLPYYRPILFCILIGYATLVLQIVACETDFGRVRALRRIDQFEARFPNRSVSGSALKWLVFVLLAQGVSFIVLASFVFGDSTPVEVRAMEEGLYSLGPPIGVLAFAMFCYTFIEIDSLLKAIAISKIRSEGER